MTAQRGRKCDVLVLGSGVGGLSTNDERAPSGAIVAFTAFDQQRQVARLVEKSHPASRMILAHASLVVQSFPGSFAVIVGAMYFAARRRSPLSHANRLAD